jgi:uncharacterized tellurite resistance protein B-like protein
MNQISFEHLLFRTAFCVMSCDGEVHDREVEELKLIAQNTTYFPDIDLNKDLSDLLDDVKANGKGIIDDLFAKLRESELGPIEELLLIEVTLRIINADEALDDNEVRFIQLLRKELKVHDEIIIQRFGYVGYLVGEGRETIKSRTHDDAVKPEWALPNMVDIEQIDLTRR